MTVDPSAAAPGDDALETAIRFLRAVFGVDAVGAAALGSNEDLNVVASTSDGRRVLLKVSHPGISRDSLQAQNAALRRLREDGRVPFEVPLSLESAEGGDVKEWVDGSRLARALTFVEGTMVGPTARPPVGLATRLGDTAGKLAAALVGFEHHGLADGGQWDLRNARAVVEDALPFVEGTRVMDAHGLVAALTAAQARFARVATALRVQAIHGDLTADNVVFGDAAAGSAGPDGAAEVRGVIDFGDVGRGWLVAEIAVCACSLLHYDEDPIQAALDAVVAFDRECVLDEADIVALWPLVVTRAVVLVASAARVLAEDPANSYALARAPLERRMLERAVSLTFDEAEILVRAALGRLSPMPAVVTPMIASLGHAEQADLSVASAVHSLGGWTDAGHIERTLLQLGGFVGTTVTRYAEHRLTAQALTEALPRSFAIGIDAVVHEGTLVRAPADGVVTLGRTFAPGGAATTMSVGVVVERGATAWARGVEPLCAAGERVAAGDVIASAVASQPLVPATGRDTGPDTGLPDAIVGIGWSLAAGLEPPAVVAPRTESLWRAACPDPWALVGRAPTVESSPASVPATLLDRRDAVFAAVQEHYYVAPPQIERGWRHHLVDTAGRAYIDMINNVAILGHGEPLLTQVVAEQMGRLNTNSRFHYEALVEFSEALAGRAPAGLDVVMLVNSGSEAVDLAIRTARAATGRSDILALTEAYHGWTVGADAISTSIGDNPGALATRPDWVHLLDAPNTYRGRHRGPNAHRYLDDALARLDDLDARGVALAGMVSEPIFGNGGGILLPDGYLRGVWEAVRMRGGVCVSDEVQVSYGRLGEHFWGFEQQGVVPDVIAVAKAMGNGHPLGAVITTREIADAFAAEGSFFSSAGGSPVSCVVGSTVLRVLDERGLQENAHVVGTLLADGLRTLAARYPALGAVHGMGLYLGVEVVRGGPDDPDPEAAAAICVDLLEEGMIVQPTGDHKNVLKIKPPLTIDAVAVGRFLAALEGVLERRGSRAAM